VPQKKTNQTKKQCSLVLFLVLCLDGILTCSPG
jgi:hypothetical protein